MKIPQQLASEGISNIEEAILTVLLEAREKKEPFISQAKIIEELGIKGGWDKSHWLINSLLNKLKKEKRIFPKYDGNRRRIGFKTND